MFLYSEKPEAERPSEEPKSEKTDISKLLAIVPPATEVLGRRQKPLVEKRIRVRFNRSLNKPVARIPATLASELGINNGDEVEVVVAGRKKVKLVAEITESSEVNVVEVYPAELERQGVADYSIATIRKCST